MALTESYMLPLKTEAPSFSLTNVVSGQKESLKQLKGSSGTLIIFMCNHCPYVVHLMDAIVNTASKFSKIGVNTIAISSNSIISHPQDGPDPRMMYLEDCIHQIESCYSVMVSNCHLSYLPFCSMPVPIYERKLWGSAPYMVFHFVQSILLCSYMSAGNWFLLFQDLSSRHPLKSQ